MGMPSVGSIRKWRMRGPIAATWMIGRVQLEHGRSRTHLVATVRWRGERGRAGAASGRDAPSSAPCAGGRARHWLPLRLRRADPRPGARPLGRGHGVRGGVGVVAAALREHLRAAVAAAPSRILHVQSAYDAESMQPTHPAYAMHVGASAPPRLLLGRVERAHCVRMCYVRTMRVGTCCYARTCLAASNCGRGSFTHRCVHPSRHGGIW